MPLDPQLRAQLRQVIAIATSSGTVNGFGEIQVGSVATCFARIENLTLYRDKLDGFYEKTKTMIIMDSDAPVPTYSSRIWLPGESPTSAGFAAQPINIMECIDENGNRDHWEVIV